MYEHAKLQEAYTGALIAGKGKSLNNINLIMERSRYRIEEWVRVRFGAGTPWRRCWCVITPPDDKEVQKAYKEWKKRSPYDRSGPPVLKGDIKFFDTKLSPKKQKKVKPLAMITDSHSAYAIYPQAKSLIDASTLVKIEGNITYYLDPPSTKEGFVFVMPEVPPAVSGFEMLLRFLFPTWDVFGLYGRPGRLVASTLDQRSLMFAMPQPRRSGYLELIDVITLISIEGSASWSEKEWRKKLKELTAHHMASTDDSSTQNIDSRKGSKRKNRISMGNAGAEVFSRPRVNFADAGSVRSGRSMTVSQKVSRTDSAPPVNRERDFGHARNSSDPSVVPATQNPLGYAGEFAPADSLEHEGALKRPYDRSGSASSPEGQSSEEDLSASTDRGTPTARGELEKNVRRLDTPEPVTPPPPFARSSAARPAGKPYHSPELRQANTRLSQTTLKHIMTPVSGRFETETLNEDARWESDNQVVHTRVGAKPDGMMANNTGSQEALNPSPRENEAARLRSPLSESTMSLPEKRYNIEQIAANVSVTDSPGPLSAQSTRSNRPVSQSHAFHQQKNQHGQQIADAAGTSPPHNQLPVSDMSSISSLASFIIDPDTLDLVGERDTNLDSERHVPGAGLRRRDTTGSGSDYDDDSTTSPDYASTAQSDGTAGSVERPRAGTLRTVGDINFQPRTQETRIIPEINFGPTYNLVAPLATHSHNKSLSQDSTLSHGSLRPGSANRNTSTARQISSKNVSHNRQASDDTIRRMPWQAGAATIGTMSPGRSISPQEFVQQRAAQTPIHQHQRKPSSNTLNALRAGTRTPPMTRAVAYEPAARPIHTRSHSSDLLQRPSSRGLTLTLNPGSSLSAREQEEVARMTGSSLLQVDGRRPEPQSTGLVGAIAQREREKQQMKQGFGNKAVQHAIHQRQNSQVYQQQLSSRTQPPHQIYGMPNWSSPSVHSGIPYQSQLHQKFEILPNQAAMQGGGWARPSMNQPPNTVALENYGPTGGIITNQGGQIYQNGQQNQGAS